MVAPHLVDIHDTAQIFLSIPHLGQNFRKLQVKNFIIISAKISIQILYLYMQIMPMLFEKLLQYL
jgi:hypothetical protein